MASPRTDPGPDGVVYRADCPSRPILDQIADKWSMMVLAVLEKPHRFNEIKRRLEGVTQRVLTQTLRRLERNGMIERRVLPTSPVGVEYSLTPLGESLREPFGGSTTGRSPTPARSRIPSRATTVGTRNRRRPVAPVDARRGQHDATGETPAGCQGPSSDGWAGRGGVQPGRLSHDRIAGPLP